jgi:hypothetical protein
VIQSTAACCAIDGGLYTVTLSIEMRHVEWTILFLFVLLFLFLMLFGIAARRHGRRDG